MCKQFLKNNPTIVFGIGLPLLLVIILSVAAKLPDYTEDPPKYEAVYTDGNIYNNITIAVENGKIKAAYRENCHPDSAYIYIFNPVTNHVRDIKINIPEIPKMTDCARQDDKLIPLAIPELENITLDPSSTSPDGYTLSNDSYNSGGVVTTLFFSRGYYSDGALVKGSRRVHIPHTGQMYYNAKLVGWILPK